MIIPFNDEDWNNIIRISESNVFHTVEWKNVLEKSFGFQSRYIISKYNNIANGAMPVFQVNSFLFGKHLVSLPFSFGANPIYSDKTILEEMLKEFKGERFEIKSTAPIPKEVCEEFGLKESIENYLTVLDLKDETFHWDHMDKKHRNAIRKSEKDGLVIREGTDEDLEEYYNIKLKLNAKKYGIPTESFKFYLNLWYEFFPKQMIKMYIAEFNGKPVGGIIIFKYKDEMLYYSGAADEKYLHLKPYNLLIWEAIKFGCRNNFKKFNFGTSIDDGLRDFKESWGASSVQIPVYSTEKKSTGGYSLFTKVWKIIPTSISRYIGPFLVKQKGG